MVFSIIGSILLLLIASSDMSKATCPNIIPRSEWGARTGSSSPLVVNPPSHVVIHHAASRGCTNKTKCIKLVKSFQNYHMDTKDWGDIAYNFLVGEDGNIYQGRGWGKTGTHAPKYNSKSIGICVIGTFISTLPNSAALDAVKELIACGVAEGQIKEDYRLIGHRQVRDTECPGSALYEEIKLWPHWTSEP